MAGYINISKCIPYIIILIIFLLNIQLYAQERPKIGLTLSGGGAKGLAHIGILSAIDSAGLHIDYVTGTSMGGVMGGLYALGYSGDSIRKIANSVDWKLLLSNKPLLRSVSIEEKKELNRYAVELPFTKWKPTPFTGIIDGQELWITLKKYFLPAYNIKDFSKLPKSFLCIGTDIETGIPVVLKDGNLTDAVRATMAIPSVFTSVEYNGKTLVDGGLLRNFPVSDVKELGADIVIGVNVGAPLAKAEELNSPISVLYQVTGFADAHDYGRQKELCNIFVEPDISSYTAASFGAADSILNIGYAEGKKQYPIFKALADSLNKIYPNQTVSNNQILGSDSVYITKVSFTGIDENDSENMKAIFAVQENHYYTAEEINEKIRQVYGTRNYTSIKYDLISKENNTTELAFDIIKASGTIVKAGIHYNTYGKSAIIAGVTLKNKIFRRSKIYTKFNISENPRAIFEFKKYFSSLDKYSFNITYDYTNYDIQLTLNNKGFADYRATHQTGGINISRYFKNTMITLGTDIVWERLKPLIGNFIYADGRNMAYSTFAQMYFNSLDKTIYPTTGWHINARVCYYFNQHPEIVYYIFDEEAENVDDDSFRNYPAIFIKSLKYTTLSPKSTLFSSQNLGFNFENSSTLNGTYYVGGLTDFEFNQIAFSGLSHTSIITESSASFGIGWQYNIAGKIYSKLQSDFGIFSFEEVKSIYEITAKNNFVSGYAVTLGMETIIGPIEFSIMYNDMNYNVAAYINLGLHF